MGEAESLDEVLEDALRVAAQFDLVLDPAAVLLAGRAASFGIGAGGRGGGFSAAGIAVSRPSEPVATPGDFASAGACPSRAMRRMVLRSTPIRRSISRWPRPWRSSVSTVIRRCGLKTFTPRAPDQKGGQRNVPPLISPRRRPAPVQPQGGGVSTGQAWGKMGGRQGRMSRGVQGRKKRGMWVRVVDHKRVSSLNNKAEVT